MNEIDHRASHMGEDLRFRRLFTASPDPVWIIDGNRFVECNDAAVALLGYADRQEFLFTHPSELSPPVQPDGQASHSKAERLIAQALERGLVRFEWVHKRADGSEFPAEVTLMPLELDGRTVLYCLWRDITERKRAEADLRLAASVFQASREGILVTDRDGVIQSVNPAFTEITGYGAEEALGHTPRLLRSEHHDPAFYAALWRTLTESGSWQGEVWNRRKNGEAYLQWTTISAIADSDGRPHRYVSVFSDVTDLRRKDDMIKRQAYHDALTGLPNRLLLADRLDQAIRQAQREGTRVALLFLDLDHFKVVNDSLGHEAGDRLLQAAAQRIQAALRRSDTVARLGGDEFVVLLSDFDDADEVAQVAEKVIAAMKEPFAVADRELHSGTSVGIAVFPQDGEDAATLMRNGDAAMYRAKAEGRGTFAFFDPSMNERALARLEMEGALRRALVEGGFELFYQPKMRLSSGRACGAEALIRWRTETGVVPPSEFIPLAEETGLIIPIGEWVMAEACRQLARWRAEGLTDLCLAINISPRQFRDDRLADRLAHILEETGVPGQALEIELTESAVMEDPASAIKALERIRALGVGVSVDDFGTGYSSLAYLRRFPINTLKIDRSFIAAMGQDAQDAAIVRMIVALARTLRLEVVAEGVEEHEQLGLLENLGCDMVQGFVHSRPLPPSDFTAWLASQAVG